jgi:hypothetical protein
MCEEEFDICETCYYCSSQDGGKVMESEEYEYENEYEPSRDHSDKMSHRRAFPSQSSLAVLRVLGLCLLSTSVLTSLEALPVNSNTGAMVRDP